MISIMHISDLHRSAEDPISNEELIASLVTDRTRYTKSGGIHAPNVIIVSGDIIQGVGLGIKINDARRELDEQYTVAEAFLGKLADEFIDGDRSRLIIAPGNHDVDWNLARESMTVVAPTENIRPKDALRAGSKLRWSWKERNFFRITNVELYRQRFDAYWDFIERFYAGVQGIPIFSRNEQYSLFQVSDGKIGIAVFNSCYENDCYAVHGAIDRAAIASAHNQMRELSSFKLWMAVWHHNIHGSPYRDDYMDADQVRDMVGYGFRLGLHGHQHKHQVIPTQIHLPESEIMAVVSAGSLCAGAKELPTGNYRQYNIIEIQDDLLEARVHVRQMETAHLFSPCHLTHVGGRSYVDIKWSPPLFEIDQKQQNFSNIIFKAERALKQENNPSYAAELLLPILTTSDEFVRELFAEAAVGAKLWQELVQNIVPPKNIRELTAILKACEQLRKSDLGLKFLITYAAEMEMSLPLQREFERRFNAIGELNK